LLTYSADSKQRLVQKFKACGKDFHGFWIASPHETFDAAAVTTTTEFVNMVEEDPTILEMMPSIFEFSQNVKATSNTKKISPTERRMGDNKRKHLVWTEWNAELTRRLKDCRANLNRLDHELQSAKAAVASFAAFIAEEVRDSELDLALAAEHGTQKISPKSMQKERRPSKFVAMTCRNSCWKR